MPLHASRRLHKDLNSERFKRRRSAVFVETGTAGQVAVAKRSAILPLAADPAVSESPVVPFNDNSDAEAKVTTHETAREATKVALNR